MKFSARAPGTCGELIQGTWNGTNFLVTCPINLYSTATVELNYSDSEVVVNEGCEKTARAVRYLLDSCGYENLGAIIEIASELPKGKGMASSTADITAASVAVAEALGLKLSADEIARVALTVEPTDGLMFSGITAFDHVKGVFQRPLPGIPAIDIVVVDTGGAVDTTEFNDRVNLKLLNRLNEPYLMEALEELEAAMKADDLAGIGSCATTSAFANQKILEKPDLEILHKISQQFGGVGVNVAHSGTVVGLLFARNTIIDLNLLRQTVKELTGCQVMSRVSLMGGGAEVWNTDKEGQGPWHPFFTCTEEIFEPQQKSME